MGRAASVLRRKMPCRHCPSMQARWLRLTLTTPAGSGCFSAGGVPPAQYPFAPQSVLLANRGGKFEDVTDRLAPGLRTIGLVTSVLWSDVDADGWPDLLLPLEWGHVKYFHNNQGGGFEDWTEKAGFAAPGTGWWTAIAAADFNWEGRPDYVVGNAG